MDLKEILRWLHKLLPNQKMQDTGSGNIQAGHVGGDVFQTQNTTRSQTIYNHTVYVLHTDSFAPVSPMAPAAPADPEPVPEALLLAAPAENAQVIENEQLALLRLMRSSQRLEGLGRAFMRREFGDAYVKALSRAQVYRTMRYLQACISNDSKTYQETA